MINPVPQKIPVKIQNDPELSGFFKALVSSIYQMGQALNGNGDITLICSTEDVDVTTLGITELLKVPQNKNFVPVFVVIRPTDFTAGTKSIQASASFGGNSPNYDDFINSSSFAVSSAGTYFIANPSSNQLLIQAPQTSFGIKINTASNATLEKWAVDLFGYFV